MAQPPKKIFWKKGELLFDRCRIMGILNVTPDSFSDGGKHDSLDQAIQRAWQIKEEGADVLDVGGESTRPGSEGVTADVERDRVFPVLRHLKRENYPLPISLDSSKPELVEEGLKEDLFQIVNDVEGLRNTKMQELVRAFEAPAILMHMFGQPRTMQKDFHYDDVVKDIIRFFRERLDQAKISSNIVLDPGIGFGKSVKHNLLILQRLEEFNDLGHPILVGISRKTFIGKVLELDVDDRLEGGLAATSIAVFHGAGMVRTHDVQSTYRVVRMAEALRVAHAA